MEENDNRYSGRIYLDFDIVYREAEKMANNLGPDVEFEVGEDDWGDMIVTFWRE